MAVSVEQGQLRGRRSVRAQSVVEAAVVARPHDTEGAPRLVRLSGGAVEEVWVLRENLTGVGHSVSVGVLAVECVEHDMDVSEPAGGREEPRRTRCGVAAAPSVVACGTGNRLMAGHDE